MKTTEQLKREANEALASYRRIVLLNKVILFTFFAAAIALAIAFCL